MGLERGRCDGAEGRNLFETETLGVRKVTREGPPGEGKGGVGKGVGGIGKTGRPFGGAKVRQLKGKGKAKEAGDAMDGELWTARMSTSKRHHSLQPSQSAFLGL